MHEIDAALYGTDLFGEPISPAKSGALAERFEFPPFSVLNAREGDWQDRKRAWISMGIQSELGRGADLQPMAAQELGGDLNEFRNDKARSRLLDSMSEEQRNKFKASEPGGGGGPNSKYNRGRVTHTTGASSNAMSLAGGFENNSTGTSGTSIFDPVLCELIYRWFIPAGGKISDPFAGGSVRGIVAGLLGFSYFGVDLRPEQISANEKQRETICPQEDIKWECGDSREISFPESDFVFSCPPYGDLEQYSDDPRDLSTMDYDKFINAYTQIIINSTKTLKQNRMACFVVGDFRNRKTGMYRGFVADTIYAFREAGLELYNDAILITCVGSLPVRVSGQFEGSRKLGKTHQNVLVFAKGDPKKAFKP